MGKVLEFRIPPRQVPPRDPRERVLSPQEAIDALVTAMVRHIVPLWIEKQWPFRGLEYLAIELRDAMSKNTPQEVRQWQIDAMIEELKPAWSAIAEEAIRLL